ncbi:MAG: DUF2442 domain-containing protein [Planctomycetes bacterium]|nr:DUF2442 domain-containing protein [Planctomycetota bacterium]
MNGQPSQARIVAAESLADFRVQLRYDDGLDVTVDFRPIIERGGVFARLGDASVFAQLRIDSRGRSICWPGEIDFCADSLREMASSSVVA